MLLFKFYAASHLFWMTIEKNESIMIEIIQWYKNNTLPRSSSTMTGQENKKVVSETQVCWNL